MQLQVQIRQVKSELDCLLSILRALMMGVRQLVRSQTQTLRQTDTGKCDSSQEIHCLRLGDKWHHTWGTNTSVIQKNMYASCTHVKFGATLHTFKSGCILKKCKSFAKGIFWHYKHPNLSAICNGEEALSSTASISKLSKYTKWKYIYFWLRMDCLPSDTGYFLSWVCRK